MLHFVRWRLTVPANINQSLLPIPDHRNISVGSQNWDMYSTLCLFFHWTIYILIQERQKHIALGGDAHGLTRNRKASLQIVDTAERTAIAIATLAISGPLFGHVSVVAVVDIVGSLGT